MSFLNGAEGGRKKTTAGKLGTRGGGDGFRVRAPGPISFFSLLFCPFFLVVRNHF
jgi:hypothetical protein